MIKGAVIGIALLIVCSSAGDNVEVLQELVREAVDMKTNPLDGNVGSLDMTVRRIGKEGIDLTNGRRLMKDEEFTVPFDEDDAILHDQETNSASANLVEVNGYQQKSTTALFCQHGRLVPRFFILGCPKTSTSTFASNLHMSHNVKWPRKDGIDLKELHFFNKEWDHLNNDSVRLETWLEYYPLCNDTDFDHRLHEQGQTVAVDFTPAYFLPGIANRIASFYPGVKQALSFGVFIREPVVRIHSHFHFYKKIGQCEALKNLGFEEWVQRRLSTASWDEEATKKEAPLACVMTPYSFYVEAFIDYFSVFHSSQFMIIPYSYGLSGKEEVVREMERKLAVPYHRFDEKKRLASSHRPSLDSDIDPAVLAKFQERVHSRTGVKLMARALLSSEAHLFNFTKDVRKEDDLAEWIANGW